MKMIIALIAALPLMAAAASGPKIIALGGDVTEIIYALDAQKNLVARDSTSLWPPEAQKLPDVGYLRQLNAEGILSMRPTQILASDQAQPSLVLEQMKKSGVDLVTVPEAHSLQGIDDKVRIVAQAIGKNAAGESLRRRLHDEIAALPATPVNKRVLFILSHGGMNALVAGQKTSADAAIQAAGLHNAMQGFNRYQPLSREGIIASKADLVVISADGIKGLGGEKGLWQLPGLALTPAGQHKQVLVVDDMALLGFSVRTPAAIKQLREKAEQID